MDYHLLDDLGISGADRYFPDLHDLLISRSSLTLPRGWEPYILKPASSTYRGHVSWAGSVPYIPFVPGLDGSVLYIDPARQVGRSGWLGSTIVMI